MVSTSSGNEASLKALKEAARKAERAIGELNKLSSALDATVTEITQQTEEAECLFQETLFEADQIRVIRDENAQKESELRVREQELERDIIRNEGLIQKLNKQNKPVAKLIQDVLLALELDESPQEIAAKLREQYQYLNNW